MPTNIQQTFISAIKRYATSILKAADMLESLEAKYGLPKQPSWDELQSLLFPTAIDQFCPRMFLGLDEWQCTCECAKCRKKPIPIHILVKFNDFNVNSDILNVT